MDNDSRFTSANASSGGPIDKAPSRSGTPASRPGANGPPGYIGDAAPDAVAPASQGMFAGNSKPIAAGPNAHVSAAQAASRGRLSRAQMLTVSGFLVGILLVGIDNTIVGTIIPAVVADLHGLTLASWFFAGYLLAQTASAPVLGKLSDQLGVKPLFRIGLSIFAAGSMLCGVAQSVGQLIAFRVVQGIGAGALFPIALSAISQRFPPQLRGRLQGFFSAVFALSSVCGPLIGSLILRYGSWRYAFFVNLPIALVAAVLVEKRYEAGATRTAVVRIDYAGAALLTTAVTALLFAVVRAGQTGRWASGSTFGLLAVAAVGLAMFATVETRAAQPILPPDLLRRKWAVALENLLVGALMFAAILFVPMFVQGALAGGKGASGWALLPLMLSMTAGSTLAGRIINRFGVRVMMYGSMILFALGFFLLFQLGVHGGPTIIACMILVGVGMGVGLVSLIYAMMSGLPPQLLGVGASSVQFFRNLGGLVGVNVLATLHIRWFAGTPQSWSLGAHEKISAAGGLRTMGNVLFSSEGGQLYPPEILRVVRDAFGDATTRVFGLCALLTAVGGALVMFLPKRVVSSAGSAERVVSNERRG